MESCAECRARQQRERQYLERLRGAAVPEASQDLTARLLARTEELAGPTAATPAQGAQRRGPRFPALAAGGAVAALAMVAGTGYLMGGDVAVPADATAAAVLARPDAAGQPAKDGGLGSEELLGSGSGGETGEVGGGVGLGLGGEPDFTPAGALSAGQLAAFRSQGWTCPELHELGYHLIWARAGVFSGEEVLELRLTDGRHFATVLEQHVSTPGTPGVPSPARTGVSPINVLTGHAAVADGFTVAGTGTTSPIPGSGDGALWINPAPPYRAIYQTASATYTYISDLPAEQADDGAAALTRVSSDAPVPGSREGIPERIERGLSRILEHLAP